MAHPVMNVCFFSFSALTVGVDSASMTLGSRCATKMLRPFSAHDHGQCGRELYLCKSKDVRVDRVSWRHGCVPLAKMQAKAKHPYTCHSRPILRDAVSSHRRRMTAC
ncbi:hypothetical protein PENSPDRAFT_108223 [Peniophora sp. CONT]|nr:hypothetical protein PENSPDRAFT_108223 [Peniophora sp. CONT]